MRKLPAGLVAAVILAACAHLRTAGSVPDCQRVGDAPLPASASTQPMAGDFILTMVATGGPRAGRTVTGTLTLVPQDSALRQVERATQPLRGAAEIAVDSLGATRPGDFAAPNPEAPGVAVYEQRAPNGTPTVVIRFGQESNARGAQIFDAANVTGFVKRITADGFAGGWSSSAGSVFPRREAQGYFCAVRIRT